jgi:phage gpG-like protein
MITFTVEGIQELVNAFDKVARGIVDLRQLGTWKAVTSEFRAIQKEIFDSEGPGWAALTPEYKAYKVKKWGEKPILQASGAMYKDFTAGGDPKEEAQSLTFNFKAPAGYHMSKDARSKMPYRSSLDLTAAQDERIKDAIRQKLKQLIDNAKLRDIRGF